MVGPLVRLEARRLGQRRLGLGQPANVMMTCDNTRHLRLYTPNRRVSPGAGNDNTAGTQFGGDSEDDKTLNAP